MSSLKIRNNWKQTDKNRWDWEAFIDDYGSGELDEVKEVKYILHPTFKKPVRITRDRESQFKMSTNGWGTFVIKVIVVKNNGDTLQLKHDLHLSYNPAEGTTP